MNTIDKSNFTFKFESYGIYKVTYTEPKRRNYYVALIHDMQLIDDTKSEEFPKKKDLEALKRAVKYYGTRYNKFGKAM